MNNQIKHLTKFKNDRF